MTTSTAETPDGTAVAALDGACVEDGTGVAADVPVPGPDTDPKPDPGGFGRLTPDEQPAEAATAAATAAAIPATFRRIG
jgi:hypothetical protein